MATLRPEHGSDVIGSPESLRHHLDWLYGPRGVYPGNASCRCEHAWKALGRWDHIDMGKGWVRTTTHPDCPHHGTAA